MPELGLVSVLERRERELDLLLRLHYASQHIRTHNYKGGDGRVGGVDLGAPGPLSHSETPRAQQILTRTCAHSQGANVVVTAAGIGPKSAALTLAFQREFPSVFVAGF